MSSTSLPTQPLNFLNASASVQLVTILIQRVPALPVAPPALPAPPPVTAFPVCLLSTTNTMGAASAAAPLTTTLSLTPLALAKLALIHVLNALSPLQTVALAGQVSS